ncbi:MAG: sigma-70 family RNA polymerase sigma factor, partial [Polyangiaceae bacterium]
MLLRRAEESAAARTSGVLPIVLDDAALLARVRAKDPKAGDLLVEHCKGHIERVLYRVLGRTDDLDDLLHDTLIAVLEGVGGLREDVRFRGWLTQVTVFVARGAIRKRRRKWWLVFTDEVPERGSEVDDDTSEAMRATYRVLDQLGPDERIAFALRKIEGMELT